MERHGYQTVKEHRYQTVRGRALEQYRRAWVPDDMEVHRYLAGWMGPGTRLYRNFRKAQVPDYLEGLGGTDWLKGPGTGEDWFRDQVVLKLLGT